MPSKTDKPDQPQPPEVKAIIPSDTPFLRKNISRATKIKIAIFTMAITALIGYLIFDVAFHGPLTTLLSNRDQLVASVESFGIFAPLLYIVLQILQTVAAPIPGQIVGSVGGFLFGPWGILWTTIGTLIGCWIVFKIARRFGRPLLEKIFKKSIIDKFDFILDSKSTSLILFAIFLLPGFPDDAVCYIAGLTKVPISRLVVLVALGRLPTIVMTNYLGAGITENLPMVAAVAIISVIILGLAVWQREKILSLLKGEKPNQNTNKKPDQKSKN